jgi:hypothetical protein
MQGFPELYNQSNCAKSSIHAPPECMLMKFNQEEQAIMVSCLVSTLPFSSWETRVQSLVGLVPLLKILKYSRRKFMLPTYIDIMISIDFRVFSDKDVKINI